MMPSAFLSPRTTDTSGLHRAISDCRFRHVRSLLQDGALTRKRNTRTPVLLAALHITDAARRRKMFQMLVKQGANIYAVDPTTGRDILTWACFLNYTTEVAFLFNVTCGDLDLTSQDLLGNTPLHYAALADNAEVTRMISEVMCRFRLSVDVSNSHGVTPFIIAKRRNMQQVEDVLVNVGGANPNQFDPIIFSASKPDKLSANNRPYSVNTNVSKSSLGVHLSNTSGESNGLKESVSTPNLSVSKDSRSRSPPNKTGQYTTCRRPSLNHKKEKSVSNRTYPKSSTYRVIFLSNKTKNHNISSTASNRSTDLAHSAISAVEAAQSPEHMSRKLTKQLSGEFSIKSARSVDTAETMQNDLNNITPRNTFSSLSLGDKKYDVHSLINRLMVIRSEELTPSYRKSATLLDLKKQEEEEEQSKGMGGLACFMKMKVKVARLRRQASNKSIRAPSKIGGGVSPAPSLAPSESGRRKK